MTQNILPDSTNIYQVDDGTIFYVTHYPKNKLYVKWKNEEICANIQNIESISHPKVHNNDLYFMSDKKDEVTHYGVGLTIIRADSVYVYRMCDNPEKDGILVNIPPQFDGAKFKGVHSQNYKKIVGVNKGIITLRNSYRDFIAQQLPEGYYLDDERAKLEQDYTQDKTYGNEQKSATVEELEVKNKEQIETIEQMTQRISAMEVMLTESDSAAKKWTEEREELIKDKAKLEIDLRDSLNKIPENAAVLQKEIQSLQAKNYQMKVKLDDCNKALFEAKHWALTSVRHSLRFEEHEKLSKPLIVIQLDNRKNVFFDNAKPFELFFMVDETKVTADLKLQEGEFDCSFRGTIGDCAYFSTIRGKVVRFFRASIGDGQINIEQINEMRTSEISLFKNQPLFYIEQSREWVVYQYTENYNDMDGEKFDISEINLLSKYERQYHKGILYLFRETGKANIERVNEKVVKVEGPLLDEMSFYTPSDSDLIYIVNQDQNVLLILNTIDLTVSQQCYEPPAGSNNHSIVGIHEGILTMAFDGIWGRQMSTTKLH